jgi:hypothetical protein
MPRQLFTGGPAPRFAAELGSATGPARVEAAPGSGGRACGQVPSYTRHDGEPHRSLERGFGSTSSPTDVRPIAIWAAATAVAIPAGAVTSAGPEVAALAGGACAVVMLRAAPVRMLASLLALATVIGVDGGSRVPWLVAGCALALAASYAAAPAVAARGQASWDELGRHLSACRRRGDGAEVLVARVPRLGAPSVRELAGALRIADSVAVAQRGTTVELHAVVDSVDLDREGLEERLRALCGPGLSCGWARFPQDGVTLDALLEQAREEVPALTLIGRSR